MWAGNFGEARRWLENAKVHSGYALETIVHFRIHTAIRTMKHAEEKVPPGSQHVDAETTEATKSSSGLRSIWSELSRRLTFGGEKASDDNNILADH